MEFHLITCKKKIGMEDLDELLDPKTNILAGITLLSYHLDYVTNYEHMILRYQVGATNYEEMIQNETYSIPALERVLEKADEFSEIV